MYWDISEWNRVSRSFSKGGTKTAVFVPQKKNCTFLANSSSIMPHKQGLGRQHKKGTGNYEGRKRGRAQVSVAHPQPYSLTPLKPNDNDVVAPAAVAMTDREFATITKRKSLNRWIVQASFLPI
jgi:hypothetical protein